MKFLKGCFISLALLTGSFANASIVNFDFRGDGGNQLFDSLLFKSGSFNLTVTAHAWTVDELGNKTKIDAQVEQFTQGLGVSSGVGDSFRLDDTESLKEKLMFKLTSDVNPFAKFTWTEIFFGSRWLSQLEEGEMAQVRFGYPHKASFLSGSADSYAIDLDGYSTLIDIQPGSSTEDNGFRVQAISVDVPEPSSLAILSLGLLGLGLRRVKKAR